MKETLKPGIQYELKFIVPTSKTVRMFYPESDEFVAMRGFCHGLSRWIA